MRRLRYRSPIATLAIVAVLAEIGVLGRLLGHPGDTPVSARRFRSTAVTVHTLDVGTPWDWKPQAPLGDEMALLAHVHSPVRIGIAGREVEAGAGFFLHPHCPSVVTADEATTVLCAWVPWSAIEELDDGTLRSFAIAAATPLLLGVRGFVSALVGRGAVPTVYTDYLVEKLLAEMVFGAVLEGGRADAGVAREAAARDSRPLERARTIMLLRRGDPSFGIEELARELHMSTRQLQRVFASDGVSPADELRRLRVELAQELIAGDAYAPLTVEEIATHSGFGTAAALRRAFAAQGLPSPRRRG